MKKSNSSFSVFRSLVLLMAFSLISFWTQAEMNPVQINFHYVSGTDVVVNPDTFPRWNTVSHYQNWSSRSGLSNMKDTTGVVTTLGVKITEDFYGNNSSGASSTVMDMIDDVSKYNFYGNSTKKGGITLSGLNPAATYKITVFGSRNGTSSNADVVYTLNDAAQSSLTLSCANNVTGLAIFNDIVPNTDGTLVMSLDKAASNTIGYTYLAAMRVEEAGTNPVKFLPIMINFGPTEVAGWNTLTTYSTSGAAVSNMFDTGGNTTNFSLKVTTAFYGITGTTGMSSTTTPLNMPDEVSKSDIYKNASGGAFTITGFDTNEKYKFTIFGSRSGLTADRDVVYVLNDEPGSNVTLNVANNASNVAIMDSITPNTDGSLVLTLNFGANNTSYTYINAMKIDLATTLPTGIPSVNQHNDGLKTFVSGESVRVWWNSNEKSNALVRVYNVEGKLLQNIAVSGSNVVDLDVEKSGVYLVRVQSGNNSWVTKFIK